jgi:hypothetical protein
MERSRTRPGAVPAALVALAYVLALVQRPGTLVADTKVDLYVDARSFLTEVLSAWSPTADLGHVWAGQYGGYAWPMASWFAAGDALGLPAWLVHRLWLGTLLAVAAVGMVRLLDALVDAGRGPLHVAAAVLYVANPYVTVYLGRTSVALLAHAALPWLLLLVHRGLHRPRSWRAPAAFALVLASTGGGVNAATTAWALLAPRCSSSTSWGGAASAPARSSPGPGGWRSPGSSRRRGGSCRCSSPRATGPGSWPSRSSPGRSGAPRR